RSATVPGAGPASDSGLRFIFMTSRRPPSSPLFPYTTLFRSGVIRADTPEAFVAAFERVRRILKDAGCGMRDAGGVEGDASRIPRSEEHTSELQSLAYLVCRLLLEKKKAPPPAAGAVGSRTGP